jgi:serine/threonine protein kinase
MLCGIPPWGELDPYAINNRVGNSKMEGSYTLPSSEPDMKDFVESLLECNHEKRITAAQALQHSFLRPISNDREQSQSSQGDGSSVVSASKLCTRSGLNQDQMSSILAPKTKVQQTSPPISHSSVTSSYSLVGIHRAIEEINNSTHKFPRF